MLDLLQETLVYIEAQTRWIIQMQSLFVEKEQINELLHSKISSKIVEELKKQQVHDNSEDNNMEIIQTVKQEEDWDVRSFVPNDEEEVINNHSVSDEENCYVEIHKNNDSDVQKNEFQNQDMVNGSYEENGVVSDRLDYSHTENHNAASNVSNVSLAQIDISIIEEYTKFGKKSFICSFCKRLFKQRVHARDHIRLHTGEKPFICNICKKSFCQKSNLRVHMRTHTGEKPHACSFCQQSFIKKDQLTLHCVKAHGNFM